MSHKRKAIVVSDDDSAMTLLKPFFGEYDGHLFVVYEDAYGDATFTIERIEDIRLKVNISDDEFDVVLEELSRR